MNITEVLKGLVMDSGFAAITWEQVVMIPGGLCPDTI